MSASDTGSIRDTKRYIVLTAFKTSLPIVGGYLVLGIPGGILCAAAGMDVRMVLLMSIFFYSGSGQFMIPNMFLAGADVLSIAGSVMLVSSRQLLYGSALVPYLRSVSRKLAVLCASNVTDESFGVNIERFQLGHWKVSQAFLVNCFSQASWTVANVIGFLLADTLSVSTAIASFAMTSIFLCLLIMQKRSFENTIVMAAAISGVVVCKLVGLNGPAIFIGALVGVGAGMLAHRLHVARNAGDGEGEAS